MITNWDVRFGHMTRLEFAVANPSFIGDLTLPKATVASGVAATARVNGSRWIADCPHPDCNGAEYVSFVDPFLFCHECRNAAVDNQMIKIEIPSDRLRSQVESYLVARPIAATRNWIPSETVKQLRDENREHGIRVS